MPEAAALAIHVVEMVLEEEVVMVVEEVMALHTLELRDPGSGLSPLREHQTTSNLALAAEI